MILTPKERAHLISQDWKRFSFSQQGTFTVRDLVDTIADLDIQLTKANRIAADYGVLRRERLRQQARLMAIQIAADKAGKQLEENI